MKNGVIELEDIQFNIFPSLKEEDFLDSQISKMAELVLQNENYHTYESGPHRIKEKWFYLSLIFFSSSIFSISMRCFNPKKKNIYSDCSGGFVDDNILIENELLIKKEHDEWLAKLLGDKNSYIFPWGSVESIFDKKSFSSSIVFKFIKN
jgi:hypothetical protein